MTRPLSMTKGMPKRDWNLVCEEDLGQDYEAQNVRCLWCERAPTLRYAYYLTHPHIDGEIGPVGSECVRDLTDASQQMTDVVKRRRKEVKIEIERRMLELDRAFEMRVGIECAEALRALSDPPPARHLHVVTGDLLVGIYRSKHIAGGWRVAIQDRAAREWSNVGYPKTYPEAVKLALEIISEVNGIDVIAERDRRDATKAKVEAEVKAERRKTQHVTEVRS